MQGGPGQQGAVGEAEAQGQEYDEEEQEVLRVVGADAVGAEPELATTRDQDPERRERGRGEQEIEE